MSKSQHWYDRDGKAVFEVPKAKGDGMRATTIADARKLKHGFAVTVVPMLGLAHGCASFCRAARAIRQMCCSSLSVMMS